MKRVVFTLVLFFIAGCASFPLKIKKAFVGENLSTRRIMERRIKSFGKEEQAEFLSRRQQRPEVGEIRYFKGIPEIFEETSIYPDRTSSWNWAWHRTKWLRFPIVRMTCVAICEGAYIFAEEESDKHFVPEIIRVFPEIWKETIKKWGSQDFDVDDDPYIYLLLSPSLLMKANPSVNAMVSPLHMDVTNEGSNGGDIIFIHPDIFLTHDVKGILAHELHHILFFSHDFLDEKWLKEGLANLNVYLLGCVLPPNAKIPNVRPDDFFEWDRQGSADGDYTSSFLFCKFLYQTYGLETVVKIMQDPRNGQKSVAGIIGKPWKEIWEEYLFYYEHKT